MELKNFISFFIPTIIVCSINNHIKHRDEIRNIKVITHNCYVVPQGASLKQCLVEHRTRNGHSFM